LRFVYRYSQIIVKQQQRLQGFFSTGREDDTGGLTPGKEDDTGNWEKDRKGAAVSW